ncbi:putative steroid 17-alpha-hydroxylase/17,20 lyase [Apostichopus japonicus]|uniref:Steroid 21-hydroxylase n=1 Tax=Stichopus japonicus TaxID=307972 RepID=A0A2G8LNB2_STIJA|nr:putative steroid 17-alpha-hydroxylase/17,20 lyase [Apostichopus japonicus]
MTFDSAVVANSTSLALVTITTALVGIWIWSQQKPTKDFPPGPKGWPLVGNIIDLARNEKPASVVFTEYAKEYGDIFSIRVGQRWTVVLNGAATIKEALLKKGVEFANRPTSYTGDLFSEGGRDIAFGQYSPSWKLHRKLAFSAFRKLATGDNKRFEKLVYSIVPGLTANLDSKLSEPFDPRPILASSIYNILTSLCFGKQYEFDSPELTRIMYLTKEANEIAGSGLLADYIPIFKYVPTPGQRKLEALFEEFLGFISQELEEHHEKYDGGEPKDFTEMLFQSRQEIKDEGKEDMNLITETHIRQTVSDVFSAGTDTSIFTMHWCVGLMVQYPEVQAKVAEEVDRVVGRDRLPSLNDREELVYTTATLYEVMRYSTIAPLAVPHSTSTDVEFGGYTIPKDTWILVNIYSMHFDEKLWDEPKKFTPEHFLDESGKVRLHPEGFLPFSTGRRVCIGESVAKAELFLIFAWLCQHYKFSKPIGQEEKDFAEGNPQAIVNMMKDIEVVVEKRF